MKTKVTKVIVKRSLLSMLSRSLSEPHDCWKSFLPAFPNHLILARSSLTSPWFRAKIISTDPDLAHIVVQYIDRGDTELLSHPECVADLPPGLDFKPLATLIRLDRVVDNINYEVKDEIENWLKRVTKIKEIQWKMLVKSVELEGCTKVEIFLTEDSMCSRLSDLLVDLQLSSLEDSLLVKEKLPSIPQVT